MDMKVAGNFAHVIRGCIADNDMLDKNWIMFA